MLGSDTSQDPIARFKAAHGDFYDYSEVQFDGPNSFVTVICRHHGAFAIIASTHWKGTGCRSCAEEHRKLSWGDFLKEAEALYGDAYSYEAVGKISSKVTVEIRVHCKEHDDYVIQRSDRLLKGVVDCPGCRRQASEGAGLTDPKQPDRVDEATSPMPAKSRKIRLGDFKKREEQERLQRRALRAEKSIFIARSTERHRGKYDYSEVRYQGQNVEVKVICPDHGEFHVKPSAHQNGGQCSECRKEQGNELKLSRDEFITRSMEAFGPSYAYDLIDDPFPGLIHTQTFICNRHQVRFEQNCATHLLGHTGCQSCMAEKQNKAKRTLRGRRFSKDVELATVDFIERARAKHGDAYDYSPTIFQGRDHLISFTCPEHGVSKMLAKEHLSGRRCQKCMEQDKDRRMSNSVLGQCLAAGIPYHWALKQIRNGLTSEEILAQGYQPVVRFEDRPISVGGVEYPSIAAAHRELGSKVSIPTVISRLKSGHKPEEAFRELRMTRSAGARGNTATVGDIMRAATSWLTRARRRLTMPESMPGSQVRVFDVSFPNADTAIDSLRALERSIERRIARSARKRITVNGVEYAGLDAAIAAVKPNLNRRTIYQRIKSGMSPDSAFNLPRNSRMGPSIVVRGVRYDTVDVAIAAVETDVPPQTIKNRLSRGISPDQAFFDPRTSARSVQIGGVLYGSLKEAYEAIKPTVKMPAIHDRLNRGMTIEEAFSTKHLRPGAVGVYPETRKPTTFTRHEAIDASGQVILPDQKNIAWPITFHARTFRNEDQLLGYIMGRLGVSRETAKRRFRTGDMRPSPGSSTPG